MKQKIQYTLILPTVFFILVACISSSKNEKLQLFWPSNIKKISKKWSFTHDGIDILLVTGSPVHSAHKGTVIESRYSSSYGHFIIIEFSKKWASLYAHLSKSLVKRGDLISSQQKIGFSGNSGKSYGAHLHFELLKNRIPVNPSSYLP